MFINSDRLMNPTKPIFPLEFGLPRIRVGFIGPDRSLVLSISTHFFIQADYSLLMPTCDIYYDFFYCWISQQYLLYVLVEKGYKLIFILSP